MPVRKRGDIWHVRVQIAGQRFERSTGRGATRADALALEALIRRDHVDGTVKRAPRRTIDQAVARWLTGEAALLKSHVNIAGKVAAIEAAITGQPLTRIVEVAEAIKADGIRDKLKPATINRRLAILRRVANLAHQQWGWLDADLGRRIKLLPGETARHVYLTPQEAERMAAKCEHPRVADAIRLAVMTGLREGELLGIGADQIRDGCIVLDAQTKSGRPRVVPLPQQAQGIALPLGITYATLRTYFERARIAAKLPHVRFHDLRHTYASWLVQSGIGLTAVRDLLGHANLAVTSRYAHLATGHLMEAAKAAGAKMATGQKRGRPPAKTA